MKNDVGATHNELEYRRIDIAVTDINVGVMKIDVGATEIDVGVTGSTLE